MGFRPPKGVRPPQLEGKRTGRPKGSKNFVGAWEEVLWGYLHRKLDAAKPPNARAALWWYFGHYFPDELGEFLQEYGKL
jgi:hypothetical protein